MGKDLKSTTTTPVVGGGQEKQGSQQEFGSNTENLARIEAPSGNSETPRTEDEVLAIARARCPEIAELEGRDKQADARLLVYVEHFEAMEVGKWTDEAQALWEAFLKDAGGIAKESGDTSGRDVRVLYDGPFTDMMNAWIASNEASGMDLKAQAELAHMYRKTLRELSRDLMVDTNAVKVLRARDMIKHGSPWGPSFASLFEKNRKGTTDDAAYEKIIGSSTSHDKAASKVTQGGGGSGGGGSGFIKSKL